MKIKLTILVCVGLTSYLTFSQQGPSGNPPANNTNQQARAAWYRGGNLPENGLNNKFGTRWNSPIYTITNNTCRSKLNGNVPYVITGYNGNRNGYMLLGTQNGNNANLYNSNNFGAFSQFHISGNTGTFTQSAGYRPWMRAGITFTDNQDLSYVGMRQVGNGFDQTEMTISWSDNTTNNNGPDDMVFRFTGNGSGNNGYSNNLNNVNDLDGRHIARFTPRR